MGFCKLLGCVINIFLYFQKIIDYLNLFKYLFFLTLFLFWDFNYICIRSIDFVPQSLYVLFLFHFFSFWGFRLGNFLLTHHTLILSLNVYLFNWWVHWKTSSYLVLNIFIYSLFFWFSHSFHLYAELLHLFMHVILFCITRCLIDSPLFPQYSITFSFSLGTSVPSGISGLLVALKPQLSNHLCKSCLQNVSFFFSPSFLW